MYDLLKYKESFYNEVYCFLTFRSLLYRVLALFLCHRKEMYFEITSNDILSNIIPAFLVVC